MKFSLIESNLIPGTDENWKYGTGVTEPCIKIILRRQLKIWDLLSRLLYH